jgi:hypothetical protein
MGVAKLEVEIVVEVKENYIKSISTTLYIDIKY